MSVGEEEGERKSMGLLLGWRIYTESFILRVFKGLVFRGDLRE